MDDCENEYLDDYGEQTKPPRPYTAEQIAEREEWCKTMSELVALVCAPVIDED